MDENRIISEGYKELFGGCDIWITPLPGSGSERKYYRIINGKRSIIGAFNPNRDENEAFVGFTRHFRRILEISIFIPGCTEERTFRISVPKQSIFTGKSLIT
jgi:hypothetical protein